MDVFLPECQFIHPGPKDAALATPLSQALAIPEDARLYLGEILKFLGTLALIVATAVILLMAG